MRGISTSSFIVNNRSASGLISVDDCGARSAASAELEPVLDRARLSERHMQLRAHLMSALREHLIRSQISQNQAAKLFGVRQPRVSDLMRGKVHLFSLRSLTKMAAVAGLQVDLEISNRADPLNGEFSVEAMVKRACAAGLHVELNVVSPKRGPSSSVFMGDAG